jgi:hypothetical protein
MRTTTSSSVSTVTVTLNADDSNTRFQIVPYSAEQNGGTMAVVHATRIRGDATSWLVCNGYRWVEGSQPEQWVKIR